MEKKTPHISLPCQPVSLCLSDTWLADRPIHWYKKRPMYWFSRLKGQSTTVIFILLCLCKIMPALKCALKSSLILWLLTEWLSIALVWQPVRSGWSYAFGIASLENNSAAIIIMVMSADLLEVIMYLRALKEADMFLQMVFGIVWYPVSSTAP